MPVVIMKFRARMTRGCSAYLVSVYIVVAIKSLTLAGICILFLLNRRNLRFWGTSSKQMSSYVRVLNVPAVAHICNTADRRELTLVWGHTQLDVFSGTFCLSSLELLLSSIPANCPVLSAMQRFRYPFAYSAVPAPVDPREAEKAGGKQTASFHSSSSSWPLRQSLWLLWTTASPVSARHGARWGYTVRGECHSHAGPT